MDTQAQNLRNMFTGTAFSDPVQHARMARDIGVDPIGVSGGYDPDVPMSGGSGPEVPISGPDEASERYGPDVPVSEGYGPEVPMSEPDNTFADAGGQTEEDVHATAGTKTKRKKKPTLTESEVHTTGYDPKNDPFRRHVEREFEGAGVVHVPDFIHDSYDAEIRAEYGEFMLKTESMQKAHRKNLEEKDKNHMHELREMHNKHARQMHKINTAHRDTAQRHKEELSRLNQELQNARARPATAVSGIPADLDREHEYETAPFTSRYNENKFNTGDKRRPSPFREQTRGLEPTDKYHIGARYEI
jgi:hypothetical protein